MSWLALISAVLKVIMSLTNWMHDQKMIEAGAHEAVLKGLRDADENITKAREARELVRADIARDGDARVLDDEFKRPD